MRLTRSFVAVFVLGLLITTIADIVLVLTGYEEAEILGGTYVDYWAAFAVVSNIVIVTLAKVLSEGWLKKPANYYETTDDD